MKLLEFDDLLNIENKYLDGLIRQIYSLELQLSKANSSETSAQFLDFFLSILDGFISYQIYNKREDFDFKIIKLPYLYGMILVVHPTVFIYRN